MFVLQLGAINLFSHVHVVNGVTIVHSHPQDNSTHDHSNIEYQFIHSINNIDIIETIFDGDCFEFFPQPLYTITFFKSDIYKNNISSDLASLRAPPRA